MDKEDIVRILRAQGFKVAFQRQISRINGTEMQYINVYRDRRSGRRGIGALLTERTAPRPLGEPLRRGFAVMSPEKRRHIASLGGMAALLCGHAYQWTREKAQAAGRVGGKMSGKRRGASSGH